MSLVLQLQDGFEQVEILKQLRQIFHQIVVYAEVFYGIDVFLKEEKVLGRMQDQRCV